MSSATATPQPGPRSSGPGPRRHRLRHALAIVGSGLLLATVVAVGVIATPSGAAPASADAPELTVDLPIVPAPTSVRTEPESGPQLTAAAWNLAIGTAVVTAGATRLGAPYVYSAGGPNAFDCSGFTRWAWMQLGVTLPHNSVAQSGVVDPIPVAELQPGDLVFDSVGGPPEHVGIYVGDGMMIHAPSSGNVVRYDRVGWWTGATVTAGRVRLP